jgi:bacteriorhodopsin
MTDTLQVKARTTKLILAGSGLFLGVVVIGYIAIVVAFYAIAAFMRGEDKYGWYGIASMAFLLVAFGIMAWVAISSMQNSLRKMSPSAH